MIKVLQSLQLNKNNLNIVQSINNIKNKNAIHIRIERDWIDYSKRKKKKNNELYLIDYKTLIDLYKDKFCKDVFFTTGQNQTSVKNIFTEKKINSSFILYKCGHQL